jgi:AraC-like DNA-binding protein
MAPVQITPILIANVEYRAWLFYLLPQLIKLGLVLHVIYLSLATSSGDLIVERLRMRVPFAIIFAVVVSTVITVEIGFESAVPSLISALGSLAFFLLTLSTTLFALRLKPELAAITEVAKPAIPAIPAIPAMLVSSTAQRSMVAVAENPVIAQITQLMGEDRFYANYDVTLQVLAKKLNVPAYRLRPMINQQMGFKNFNQFLNSFRVQEASERLISERHLPILSIALDCGFKSLSVFNKAFKEAYGKTPSEFRQRQL